MTPGHVPSALNIIIKQGECTDAKLSFGNVYLIPLARCLLTNCRGIFGMF